MHSSALLFIGVGLAFTAATTTNAAVWQKAGDSCSAADPKGATAWDDWIQAAPPDPRGSPSNSNAEKAVGWTTPGDKLIRETPHGNAFEKEGPYCRTIKGDFANFYLSIEYNVVKGRVKPPKETIPNTDQDFGNSGVYIFDRWEVQIIDPSQFDDDANKPGVKTGDVIKADTRMPRKDFQRNTNVPGALYGKDPVREDDANKKGDDLFVNRATPEGTWNKLEIWFCAAADGKQPVLRSDLNGSTVYYGAVADNGTGGRKDAKPLAKGPIYLQSHWGSDVQFRNPTFADTACPPPKAK